jgi:hypothetical protein
MLIISLNNLKKNNRSANSAQNFIAKFPVSCALFLLFSFCANGEISVAKPQRVLRAKRWWQAILTLRENTKVPAFSI